MKKRLTLNLLLIASTTGRQKSETFSFLIIDAMAKKRSREKIIKIFPFIYLSFALWINKNGNPSAGDVFKTTHLHLPSFFEMENML
jgi:hypothetical protein